MNGNLRHHTRSTIVTIVAVLVLLAAACSASEDQESSSPGDTFGDTGRDTSTGDDVAADDGDDHFGEPGRSGGDAEAPFVDGASDGAASDDGSGDDAAADDSVADDGRAGGDAARGDAGSAPAAEAPVDGDFGAPAPTPGPVVEEEGRFADYGIRDFIATEVDPLSTFALDVDTGAYTVARRLIEQGQLPPRESVRVEEYVNSFDYDYDIPSRALGLTIDGVPSPFDDDHHLVRIGVQSEVRPEGDRPTAALTFVIDTSGSMEREGRLELVKDSLEELVHELDDGDMVSIVAYDDEASLLLPLTRASEQRTIRDAIDGLRPGGSTNLEGGLARGYDQARSVLGEAGVNRVILLSDGIANVGLTDPDGLARQLRDDADAGIGLITVGVGLGGYNDVLMEQLADQGEGFYAYVDTEDEAERLFEDELTATLLTIAIDAKIQVEFDDDVVERYRLIGFENRGVLDDDFRNDRVDAGEVGAGHQVTAIYEVELWDRRSDAGFGGEMGRVHLRWQDPGTREIVEIDQAIEADDLARSWRDADASVRLATTVAAFAEVLRDSPHRGGVDLHDVATEADELARELGTREVTAFADLVETALRLR